MAAVFFGPQSPTYKERIPLQDHCGIVSAFSTRDIAFFPRGLVGLSLLQTRGYDGAGFCALDSTGHVYHHKGIGMVREVFSPENSRQFQSLMARVWVYQVRYGTSGGFDSDNVQPIINTHEKSNETFIVAHNGQFSQTPAELKAKQSDTLFFSQRLSQANGFTWEQRIIETLSPMRGAWSLVVATRDAIYAARDPWGFRPFVYGHIREESQGDYIWVSASETSSLDAMGATDHFELLPGSIAKIDHHGLTIISKHGSPLRS